MTALWCMVALVIIIGEKAPSLVLKAVMWELRSPRLRRWNTRQYERTQETR